MILLGSQVGTPAISPAGSNFDTMRALKSMPLRYWLLLFISVQGAISKLTFSKTKMRALRRLFRFWVL